jgi:TetR/AcrR family transcriptional repressor of mexJK operon
MSSQPAAPAESASKAVREGSAHKRAAILGAARQLFLADGFDRISVDAVAASAGVSKRTVYDYFGDKKSLLQAVVAEVARSLLAAVNLAIDEHLRDVTASTLDAALVDFGTQISTGTMGSPDYVQLRRLVSNQRDNLGELLGDWFERDPEEYLADRFVELGRQGLLDVPDPRLAVEHFTALALSPAANRLGPFATGDEGDARQAIVDGVRVFLTAYGTKDTRGAR